MPAGTTIVCSDSIALRGCATTQLGIAQPQARPVVQRRGAGDAHAVQERPRQRPQVLHRRPRDPRVTARDGGIGEHHRAGRVAPERHLPHQRHARPLLEHQLEQGARHHSPRRATRDQPAAGRDQHQRSGCEPGEHAARPLVGHAAGAGGDAALRDGAAGAGGGAARLGWSDLRGLVVVVAVVVVLARERGRGAEREGGRRGGEDGQDAVLLEEHRNPFGRSRRTAGGRRVPIVRDDPSPDNNDSGSAERGSRSATSRCWRGAPRR